MIEKLQTWQKPLPNNPAVVENMGMDNKSLFEKINELVDAVNILQESQNTYWTDIAEIKKELQTRAENVQPDAETRPENVQDKFAEQRKWIGKLCWFWDDVPEEKIIDVLSHIDTNGAYPYVMCDHQVHYGNCKPVKPDDPIIYKGE